jgi:hypothetical protein
MRRRSTTLILFLLSACMGWRPEPTTPAYLITNQKPDVVRLTRSDSSRLILREPMVDGDTVYGRPQANLEADPEERIAIPLADVTSIATLHTDPTRTTLLVAGAAVATFSILCFGADVWFCGHEEVFAPAGSLGR